MDLAARRQWVPASVSPTDAGVSSTAHGNGSSSISAIAPRVHRDDPLKGRKARRVFVDEDTSEEGYYYGKIDAVFVDDGVAHYHIVHKDEAIRLLIAANGKRT